MNSHLVALTPALPSCSQEVTLFLSESTFTPNLGLQIPSPSPCQGLCSCSCHSLLRNWSGSGPSVGRVTVAQVTVMCPDTEKRKVGDVSPPLLKPCPGFALQAEWSRAVPPAWPAWPLASAPASLEGPLSGTTHHRVTHTPGTACLFSPGCYLSSSVRHLWRPQEPDSNMS